LFSNVILCVGCTLVVCRTTWSQGKMVDQDFVR
jgi:hypothetical protein